MKRIYFLARLGDTDYLVHGYTWKHKLTEHLEKLGLSYGVPAHFIHAVHTDSVNQLNRKINKELVVHKASANLLCIDTHDPVIEIMDRYDGETIDPTYKPPTTDTFDDFEEEELSLD